MADVMNVCILSSVIFPPSLIFGLEQFTQFNYVRLFFLLFFLFFVHITFGVKKTFIPS